jgi:chromosome segregation ATPase
MSRPDLEAIRARCEASTPGPWTIEQFDGWRVLNADDEVVFDDGSASGEYAAACKPNNRDFFIAARADVPALLAYIEELTRECDDRRRRCVMLARAHGALADAGCIVPTEMDETIEHAIEALAKERDEARAEASRRLDELNMVQSQLTRALTDRDNLRAEITKAQESFDDDGPSGWMPGETAIDALIRTRAEARAEVDKLRSQIERLRGVLHIVSLDEYESTTSASEKVHAHARQARIALNETLAEVTPSDAAHIASLENLFIKACRRAENLNVALADMKAQRDEARAEADLLRGCGREHMWAWKTDGLTACAMCGVVQREDHANKPCGGVVRVGVRIEDERASAFRRGAEAMRLACIEEVRFLQRPPTLETIKSLRALPIPEDKP